MEKIVNNGIHYNLVNSSKTIYDNMIETMLSNIDELEKDEYRQKQII